jgi:hypothetical protein
MEGRDWRVPSAVNGGVVVLMIMILCGDDIERTKLRCNADVYTGKNEYELVDV